MGRSKCSYLVFGVSHDLKEFNIERRGTAAESLDSLVASLPPDSPRYIAIHYHWDLGLDGKRSRLIFIHWSPSGSTLKMKLIYAASKQSFKAAMGSGLQVDIQAGDLSELTNEKVLEHATRFNKA